LHLFLHFFHILYSSRRSIRHFGVGGLGQHHSELISLHTFLLRKELRQIIQNVPPLREDFMHPLMGFLDKPGDLLVNLAGFGFTVIFKV
jgi:hypothetical protein